MVDSVKTQEFLSQISGFRESLKLIDTRAMYYGNVSNWFKFDLQQKVNQLTTDFIMLCEEDQGVVKQTYSNVNESMPKLKLTREIDDLLYSAEYDNLSEDEIGEKISNNLFLVLLSDIFGVSVKE